MGRIARTAILILSVLLLGLSVIGVAAADGDTINVIQIKGTINPSMAGYVVRGIHAAETSGASAVVLEIDTPGGLDSSMQEIVQAIVNSRVPVIAYVSPQGGRAASAGLFIVMASHVAAMAPNTNIGSASPVSVGDQPMDETMAKKVTNDAAARIRSLAERRGRNADWAEQAVREAVNATEREALEQHIVDYVAPDLGSLLKQIDGKEVALASGPVTLKTADAVTAPTEMNFAEQFLHIISDPNIAYILMILGINGLLFELMNPGAFFPGVVGGICLILAFFALGTLPVNYAGVGLILLAFVLFVLDVMMPTHGILTAGGLASLVLGSLMLINSDAPYFAISWSVIAGVAIATGGFFLFALSAIVRSHRKPATTGREGMRGAIGIAKTDLDPHGVVLVEGENWEATSEQGPITKGSRVQITDMKGLHLTVRSYAEGASTETPQTQEVEEHSV